MLNVQYESDDSGDENPIKQTTDKPVIPQAKPQDVIIPRQLNINEEQKSANPLLAHQSGETSSVSTSTLNPNVIKNESSSCASATDEDPSKSSIDQRNKPYSLTKKPTESSTSDRFFKPKPRLPSEASLVQRNIIAQAQQLKASNPLINPNSPFRPVKPTPNLQAAKKITPAPILNLKELDGLGSDSEEESLSQSQERSSQQRPQRENSGNNSVSNLSVGGGQHPTELEEIVKMFTFDLQQSIRQRFKSKSTQSAQKQSIGSNTKKLPFEIQQMMGQANNLYAFNKFKEAIEILQQIITKMPDHAESYSTIASIYEETNELEKSLNFGVMAAFLVKTDIERWQKCADIAKYLGKYPIAIYCLNRAIKQSSEQTHLDQILTMKFQKISIYKMQKDYSSAIRTLTKLINKFKAVDSSRSYQLNLALAQTFFEQGQHQKSFEVLDELIELSLQEPTNLLKVLLLYGDISNQAKSDSEFLSQLKRQTIVEAINKAKVIQEHKVIIFQIEIRKLLCLIDSGKTKKLTREQILIKDLEEIFTLKLIEQLAPYQRVVSSVILLADKLENSLGEIKLVIELYEALVKISLQIDQPNLFYKIGLLYQKLGNYEKAREVLELAFSRCPIPQNALIRIELSTVYNTLGLNKKAMHILKNPFPHQQLGSQDQAQQSSLLKKRRRSLKRSKDEEDIIMSSSDEELKQGGDETNKDLEFGTNDSAHFVDMSDSWSFFKPPQQLNMQPPSIAGSGLIPSRSLGSAQKSKVQVQQDEMSQSDSVFKKNFKVSKELKFQRVRDQNGQQREFMLKRNRKLQKRTQRREEEQKQEPNSLDNLDPSQAVNKMKLDLIGFNSEEYVMILEQCKLCLKLNDLQGLVVSLDSKLSKILENLKTKQQLQDTMYRMKQLEESPEKEHFFLRKIANDNEKDAQAKVCQQAKIKIIEEISLYPNIFNQVNPEELLEVILCFLTELLKLNKPFEVADYIDKIKQIELLMSFLSQSTQTNSSSETQYKIFYEISTLAYLLSNQPLKAYKALRLLSSPSELLNWAMMGCIISKKEDSSFCRSYFKRVFQTKQVLNPFILMILGNNYLQKQQLDLAIKHYWLLHKSFNNKNHLLNLTLAISFLCQSYQRTNQDKEETMKRAMGLLLRYAEAREDRVEVQYNFARALQLMGLNVNAKELYMGIVKLDTNQLNPQQREIRVSAVLNLSQLLKGAGLSSGITVVEGAHLERIKYHNAQQAHDLLISNIVI